MAALTGLADRGCAGRFDPPPDGLWLADGRLVTVRPVVPDDADGERAFVAALSLQSRYRRFHFAAHELPPLIARAMTDVDQRCHVALVALADESDAGEDALTMVADARYVMTGDGNAEFAIAVADEWQGVGLGSALLARLAEHARRAGARRLVGDLLADNAPMRELVLKLGGHLVAHPQEARLRRAVFELEESTARTHISSTMSKRPSKPDPAGASASSSA